MCLNHNKESILKSSKFHLIRVNYNINLFRLKACCLARTTKNDKYYVDRMTADEINTRIAKDAEDIIYSESLRKSGINVFTMISYICGLLYWYIVPDLIKFLIIRLFLDPLRKPFYNLRKWLTLFNLRFFRNYNKGKVPLS